MKTEKLKEAICLAGGITAVAQEVGLSYEAVRKWTFNGLPRTEWTGETSYSKTISKMQSEYSADDLLDRAAF
jgi:hypothetical protein